MSDIKSYYNMKRKILFNLVHGGTMLVMVIINSSLMKFLTDAIGLSPAAFGVVFLIFSIWNGINDPIIGFWADNRPFVKGVGKYKSLIRWSIPVIGIPVIALFFTSPEWNEILISVYLLILLVIYEGGQTLLGVSFTAFTVNSFLSSEERTQVNVIASYIGMIPVFLGGMIPVWFLTGEFDRMALVGIFSGAIILGLILIWIGQIFIKENEDFYKEIQSTQNLKELFGLAKQFVTDKTFVIFMAAFFMIQSAIGNSFTGYLYYMDNVLEVSGLKATLPDMLTGIGQMAFFPVVVWLVKKYGSRDSLWKGLLIAFAGHVILTFPTNYWVVSVTYVVIFFGYAFQSAIYQPFTGLVVDHLELTTGRRQPAGVRGIMAVLLLPAASVQPLILSSLLSASGYIGGTKHQTVEVVNAIRLGTGIIPAAILLVGIILLAILPINHQREKEIQAKMEEIHGVKEKEIQAVKEEVPGEKVSI